MVAFPDTDTIAGKKIKKEKANGTTQQCSTVLSWEFGFGKTKWKPYDPTQNKNISKAFCSGEKTLDLSMGKNEYCIIFDRMVQRNIKSGWEVPMRCKLNDPADDDKCNSFFICRNYLKLIYYVVKGKKQPKGKQVSRYYGHVHTTLFESCISLHNR